MLAARGPLLFFAIAWFDYFSGSRSQGVKCLAPLASTTNLANFGQYQTSAREHPTEPGLHECLVIADMIIECGGDASYGVSIGKLSVAGQYSPLE